MQRLSTSILLAACLIHSGAAIAQSTYPNKSIRMIVPLAAGSAVDNAARILAQKMSVNMGQSVVVENMALFQRRC